MRHFLKLWPEYMQAKRAGVKDWEFRAEDDRKFSLGDEVVFQEWNPAAAAYTGIQLGPVLITYVHRDPAAIPSRCIFSHTRPRT
ncbi:MAG TPA: DUF3850 domain-containing protein [Holophaga sp.]|nr:DUF3850 domain-containing protein [Holophaga sp.]